MPVLNFTHYKQQNNADDPATPTHEKLITCNVTALSTALSCVGIYIEPMELFRRSNSPKYISIARKVGAWTEEYIQKKKLNQVWIVLEKLADEIIGRESGATFGTEWMTFDGITDCIDQGKPVLIGGSFTHGGHIVCIVGYNGQGFVVSDPWGDWATGYTSQDGNGVLYLYDKIRDVMTGNRKTGKFLGLVIG